MPETQLGKRSPIDELDSLYRDAEQMAADVNARLVARESTDRLVPQLRDLSAAVQTFRHKLAALLQNIEQLSPTDRDILRSLQQMFPELLHVINTNHQIASSAGLPVAGIGGRPYRPQPQRARKAIRQASASDN